MGLYSFTDSRDPDRILNRLKRLEKQLPWLKGGVSHKPVNNPVTRLNALQARTRPRPVVAVRDSDDKTQAQA